MNDDTKVTKSLMAECTALMASLMQEKSTSDNSTWTTLFEKITLLESRLASNKLPEETIQTVCQCIRSIKSVYASYFQLYSNAAKSSH